ncbi:MAG: CHASE2:Stage sporulation [Proteobacteria bacterium]|nr:CHASE2:Stage sporulation [Pseudomonadota bacterium]
MKRLAGLCRALLGAGRGLVLPVLLLAAAAALLETIETTPLAALRHAQFDRYQRQMPRRRDNEPVIVVAIDSQSLAEYGQWPWSRTLLARLVEKIMAGRPLAAGLDIVFAEPDRYSPAVLGKALPGLPPQALSQLPEPDQQLAQALAGGPTVLGLVGVSNALPGSRQPAKPLQKLAADSSAETAVSRFSAAIVSRPSLEEAAAGEGLINASPDHRPANAERGILRRVPSLALIGEQPFLSLPLEMVRQALGESATVARESDSRGLNGIRIGDYRLPTQSNGELLIHFGPASSHYYLSAADVLAGRHPPETFASRFVIIGFNSTGLQDSIITPLGDSVPGVDIHVQVIESLLSGEALQRPWWMPRLELAALLLGGWLLIVAVPALRPPLAVVSYAGLAALLIAAGYLAFARGRWLFDGTSLVLLLGPLFIARLGHTLIQADAGRRQAESKLQQSREAAAHAAGQLDAARRIQMGLLPDPRRLFADEKRFTVAALLEPADVVGGDFYDCFRLDENRLGLSIGDVSGKGVPASLFMAIAKTLSGTLARRESDLGQALREVERELDRENPECLFVTALIGILDADSGLFEFVCAGHDAPLLLRHGEISRLATRQLAGPPLCATAAYPYVSDRIQLQAGDRLCFFTDGVSEADNGSELFGTARLACALLAQQEQAAGELVVALRDAVRHFESGRPAADDLTLLILHYHGRQTSGR